MLNTIRTGDAAGLPVLLIHGLFGQAKNLNGLARRLAQTRSVISVDMRNHGDSPQDAQHSYAAMAADLAEVIEANGGQADVAGHSMGGKASMVLALTRPELVRRLVVMDIAPVTYGHSQSHLIDAMETLDLATLDRRSEADRKLADKVDDPGIRAFLLQSLDLKSSPPRWKLNLPVLRERMAELVGWPEDLPTATFDGPTMFLIGADSEYVTDQGRDSIRRCFPQARVVKIKGAGHWLHADAPEATAEALAAFLGQP